MLSPWRPAPGAWWGPRRGPRQGLGRARPVELPPCNRRHSGGNGSARVSFSHRQRSQNEAEHHHLCGREVGGAQTMKKTGNVKSTASNTRAQCWTRARPSQLARSPRASIPAGSHAPAASRAGRKLLGIRRRAPPHARAVSEAAPSPASHAHQPSA